MTNQEKQLLAVAAKQDAAIEAIQKPHIVRCSVRGGVTGHRESILKGEDGHPRRFATLAEAQAEAARLRDTAPRNTPCMFHYWAE
jgi:hypothetical protein